MSLKQTEITIEIENYLIKNFGSEDAFLSQLQEEARQKNMPEISISPLQGAFLQFLIKVLNARYVLEIGSLAGYSAITMAKALPKGGKLIAVEINSEYAQFIQKKVKEAGLDDVVEVVNQSGMEFLKDFKPEYELDLVFVDADKPNHLNYFKKSIELLRVGGVFSADNALAFGHIAEENPEFEPHNVKGVQALNDYVRKHPDFQSCLLPIADGLLLAVKLK